MPKIKHIFAGGVHSKSDRSFRKSPPQGLQQLLFTIKATPFESYEPLKKKSVSLWKSVSGGAFHSTKNSGNSGFGSEWNRHFPEFHSEIFGVPREVGLKFRKIGITGKFRSIRPFLLAPSFSEPGNRTQHGFQFFCSISVFRLLLCDR